jgi:hypothetical protein
MTAIAKIDLDKWLRPQRHLIAFRFASVLAALILFTAVPSHAWTYYSGASVGTDGTIYGWGVTDVTVGGMYHMAYVTTTLTSPVKHRQAYGSGNAQNSVRDDVSLPFDPNDLGTYLVASSSSGFCYVCYCWILQNAQSQASPNNAPARLVPSNFFPNCAPNGVGTTQVLSNQSVVSCSGNIWQTGFDGVNKNLVYQLVDGTGAPFAGAYTIYEGFSNFQKTPASSGLAQPPPTHADIPAGGYVCDSQYAGYLYPAVLGSNEHSSYIQSFSVTVGTVPFPISTTVSISLGNFTGMPEDNVTITTP